MSQFDLVVRLPGMAETAVGWSLVDPQTGLVSDRGELSVAPPPLEGVRRALYVLPARDTLVRRLRLPARREQEARQAAPFALEDEMASELADTEVVVGPADGQGCRIAVAASRERVETWRRIAMQIGVRPAHAVPEAWALEAEAGDLILADLGGDVLFLNRCDSGPVCGRIEAALVRRMLPTLVDTARPEHLVLSPALPVPGTDKEWQPRDIRGLPAFEADIAVSRLESATLGALPFLLGSRFSSQADWVRHLQPFKRVAGLALAGLALFVVLALGEGAFLRTQSDQIDARAEEAFRAAFPEVTRVVNLDAQLRQRVQARGVSGQSEFLRLAGVMSRVLDESDDLRIEAMRYDSAVATLGVSATYADFASFEAFSVRAREAGLIVEDGGARQTDDTLSGEFTVRFP